MLKVCSLKLVHVLLLFWVLKFKSSKVVLVVVCTYQYVHAGLPLMSKAIPNFKNVTLRIYMFSTDAGYTTGHPVVTVICVHLGMCTP